jgi:uncharacterized membrane protein
MTPTHAEPVMIRSYPFSGLFVPFPMVCFTLTLITDIAYWRTSHLMWQHFSAWLLFAGLVFGALALLAGLIDLVRPRTRGLRPSFLASMIYIVILCLAVLNSLVHAADGWPAVVPNGLILSAVTFVLIVITFTIAARYRAISFWRVA